ncbi:GOLPH3/VPS74 family protein [Kineosporia babensis]|uniref:GPP34 family phosphoprotein n=1 Tax=Kineosporia babensis TaxID=499548 RepID=A0A9X1NI28_9ACTN|nr:GPP34 family phosphoprotein [Kineosporia babensis]MCD5314430.1 GPP34 family phosphoprotein [Kineosporia babensis]
MAAGHRPEEFLIAEDLMLLLLDDTKGTIIGGGAAPYLLAGALLSDLALLERIELGPKEGLFRQRKLLPRGQGRLSNPLLQQALDEVAHKPRPAQSIVNKLEDGLDEQVPVRLVERGLVRQEEKTLLRFISQTIYPSVDVTRKQAVRNEIRGVLEHGLTARPHIAALIALLSAAGSLKRVFKDQGLPWSTEVRQRAREIQKGDWGSGVISAAVAACVSSIARDAASAGNHSSSSGGDGGGDGGGGGD